MAGQSSVVAHVLPEAGSVQALFWQMSPNGQSYLLAQGPASAAFGVQSEVSVLQE